MKYGGLLILASGFAVLIVLTAITGLMSTRRTASAIRGLVTVQETEGTFNQLIDGLQSSVYLEAIVLRDFLIAGSRPEAATLRQQLAT